LQSEEKYKGCILPPLPEKSVLRRNSQELVDKRKQELQIYLQIISNHPIIKYNPIFKAFLTYEDTEEFEDYKQELLSQPGEESIPMHSLKNLQLHDTFNYFYTSFKAKYSDTSVPEEMQIGLRLEEISSEILKYLPVLESYVKLIEKKIDFYKECAQEESNLIDEFEIIQEDNSELGKVIGGIISYNKGHSLNCKASVEYNKKVLVEIKGEKSRLEGIILAISERKANIKQYNTLLEYSKGKIGNIVVNNVEKVSQDIDKVKERIMKINENLYKELGTYSKSRTEGLSRIMGNVYKADYETGNKLAELALKAQKNFIVTKASDKNHSEELEVDEEYIEADI